MKTKRRPTPTDPRSFLVTGFFIGSGLSTLVPQSPFFGVPVPVQGVVLVSGGLAMLLLQHRALKNQSDAESEDV